MAMHTDHFDSNDTETLLAKVLTNSSIDSSLYVNIPVIGRDRRTDGGAEDMGGGAVKIDGDVHSYERGEYVTLTFEPNDYGSGHYLTYVKRAALTDPLSVDEPTFSNTDVPTTCPQCGRTAAALVQSEYDSTVGGKVDDDVDACVVDEDNRGKWFDLYSEHTFVHGI